MASANAPHRISPTVSTEEQSTDGGEQPNNLVCAKPNLSIVRARKESARAILVHTHSCGPRLALSQEMMGHSLAVPTPGYLKSMRDTQPPTPGVSKSLIWCQHIRPSVQ